MMLNLRVKYILIKNCLIKISLGESKPGTIIGRLFGNNLVNANGDIWRRQHKIIKPSFHVKNLAKITDLLTASCVQELLKQFEKIDDKSIEIHSWTQRITLDVLGKGGFNFDFGSLENDDSPFVHVYNNIMKGFVHPLSFILPEPFGSWSSQLLQKDTHQQVDKFHGMLQDVIEQKRKQKKEIGKENSSLGPVDLLDLMIESNDEEGGARLTNQELRDNVVIFFLAGHDTTSSSLSFALYLLATHPEIQKKAREHVKEILGDQAVANYEQQKKMDYLTMIIKEGLRLFPPVGQVIMRKLTKDYKFGDVFLPKGSSGSVNIYYLHHNPRYWENPEKFDPERFASGSNEQRPFFAWNPFGGGQRSCVGQEFSLIEQRLVLSSILAKYEISMPEGDTLAIKPFGFFAPSNLKLNFKRIN